MIYILVIYYKRIYILNKFVVHIELSLLKFLNILYNSLDIITILQFVKLSKCLPYSNMVYILYIILIVCYALDVPPRIS